jgi:polysaccharide biosynthesis transport protein
MAHSETGYEHVEEGIGPVNRNLMSIKNPVPISDDYPARTATAAVREDALRAATHLRVALSASDRALAITGLEEADGASILALEVARALALVGQEPVVLVGSRELPETGGIPGLAEMLRGHAEIDSVLPEPDSSGLVSIPPGALPFDPSALYSSPECSTLFAALKARFRYVIVDAGPLRTPASLLLMTRCDAIAVALATGLRRRADALEAQSEVARLRKRLVGVILTRRK